MMTIWNDNDSPLAFFLTWRTYGTWLHGDERGSIDRYNNVFGGQRVVPNEIRVGQQQAKLKSEPVILNAEQRIVVRDSIESVCSYRQWNLRSVHIRTNHGHLVVSNHQVKPEYMMRDFKAYATRALRERGLWTHKHSPWAEGGSKRYLWTDESISNACDYVVNGQGDELPGTF